MDIRNQKSQTTVSSEAKFFECPCFKRTPQKVNHRENLLGMQTYEALADRLNSHGICPNRGVVVALKVVAIMCRNFEASERDSFERQIHDMLDLELSHNPSEA